MNICPLHPDKITECIDKSTLQHLTKACSLFICKSGIFPVGLRILQVDLLMCHIEIPAADYRLTFLQFQQVCQKILFPVHTVFQSAQFTLGIWCIYSHQIKFSYSRVITRPSLSCSSIPIPYATDSGSFFVKQQFRNIPVCWHNSSTDNIPEVPASPAPAGISFPAGRKYPHQVLQSSLQTLCQCMHVYHLHSMRLIS